MATTATPIAYYTKDPDAVLDYNIDWATWLDGDTISTSVWTVPAGLTQDSSSHADGITTVFLSSGTDGTSYVVKNRIVTAGGRTDDRTISINVKQR